jgi:hypothetical protein
MQKTTRGTRKWLSVSVAFVLEEVFMGRVEFLHRDLK